MTQGRPGALKFDTNTGEGDVRFPPEWREWDPLFRADVSLDWLYAVLEEYNQARADLGWAPVDIVAVAEDELEDKRA